ncbi:hypothetical protein HIM_08952 [Hirsutella minnesotensis 3608]|uniref:Bud22 domain-containing protein n=1 Tax=Hirsutella minnesotensis 3608 TaxID=1043627 RepID=A0A0F7ZM30_9HYPO|nr:hypothetical protein HIM_08952 [Hirsutella minnesotensis 3608]
MPKRKRSADSGLQATLQNCQDEVFRALKASKGFERQRQSKRLRDDSAQPDKRQRLEREIAVLKSLDLHQTARAHLLSCLLKVKPIAESPDLPEELRAGVPKPELPDDERAALHNVTSGLYNKEPVKQAMDRAIAAVSKALNVTLPDKAKRSRKNKRTEKEEQPSDRISEPQASTLVPADEADIASQEETDFEGFETDVDEPGLAVGHMDSEDEDAEEAELSKYSHLLGSSSEDEEGSDFDDERFAAFKGRETVNLDDISQSENSSDAESAQGSESSSDGSSPPPKKQKKKDDKPSTAKTGSTVNSAFFPTLMGGYVSGSESASDIEDARPKKRRGQRARQAIWEKKYGAKAKHIQNQSQKGGRDAGWDMKRGAVDGDSQGGRTPWKKGVRNPLAKSGDRDSVRGQDVSEPPPKPTKRDDEGPLHPSWAAKKKALDAQKGASFAGQKIVFE